MSYTPRNCRFLETRIRFKTIIKGASKFDWQISGESSKTLSNDASNRLFRVFSVGHQQIQEFRSVSAKTFAVCYNYFSNCIDKEVLLAIIRLWNQTENLLRKELRIADRQISKHNWGRKPHILILIVEEILNKRQNTGFLWEIFHFSNCSKG